MDNTGINNSGVTSLYDKNNASLFLGLVDKKYMRTLYGMIHGIGAMLALIVGNYVFLQRVVMGNHTPTSSRFYHSCNFTASMITALFFWNKVQSWQLSTTTMKEKGLTPKKLQRVNQGRGVICMILFSMFPLVTYYCPEYLVDNHTFSIFFALLLIAGSTYVYNLIKDYSKILFVVYGLTPMALGISILFCCGHGGTVKSFNEYYPLVIDRIEKESSFVISCVQMGFMLYYLYSRNLVSQRTVQKICKNYHVPMMILYTIRVERDLLVNFSSKATDDDGHKNIPVLMLIQSLILTFAIFAKQGPMILKSLVAITKFANKQVQMTIEAKSAVSSMRANILTTATSIQSFQSVPTHKTTAILRNPYRRRSSVSVRLNSNSIN